MDSEFATAERATLEELETDINEVSSLDLVQELTQVLPDAFVILNLHRQIIYCNPALTSLLGISSPDIIYGMRPGEAFNCIHSNKSTGGCGTSQFCKYCGAVNAILDSQCNPGDTAQKECRLTVGEKSQSFDFKVRANTLSLLDRHFTLMIAQDISAEKRRTIMERLFFHDILNTAGGIQGLVQLMQEATREELDEFLSLASTSTQTLVEEINAQRDLLAAEKGELETDVYQLSSLELLSQVKAIYENHPVAEGKTIVIHGDAHGTDFLSDPRLLTRVLGNMVINALEAETGHVRILLGAQLKDQEIEFWVENPTPMPEEARLQVFQRSFSTKGSGRGLGTYSIRLLGETYLKGKTSFTSTTDQGTRFSIRIPLGI